MSLAATGAVLADVDLGDLLYVIIFVVIAIISAVGKLAEWLIRKQAEQKRQQEELRRQQTPAARKPPYRPLPHQGAAPPQPPGAPAQAGRPAPRRPVPARRVPPPARAEPIRLEPVELEPAARSVEDELVLQRRRLEQQQRLREARMKARTPPEADTAAIEHRLVHLRGRGAVTGEGHAAPTIEVDLADRDRARAAIVLQEILSPPKALCRGPETWEL